MDWKVNIYKHLCFGCGQKDDSYYLMRRILCTGLGLIYLNAFAIYYHQALGLYGVNGLLPYAEHIPQLIQQLQTAAAAFVEIPSLFIWIYSDNAITTVAIVGIALSFVLIFGYANFVILFILWFLHMSVIHVGQIFYSYGWETQLLELTFLSFFLFPFFDPRLNRAQSPPKKIAIYFQRWMMFRLMFGAGLIKIRGDQCWRDLTCMNFHYETQPNPHPLSWYWHHLPQWFHSLEVAANHGLELLLPFALFGPKWLRRMAGSLMIGYQLLLIFSGNLAWLNWLTLLMAIPCFDDAFLARIFRWLKLKSWSEKYLSISPKPVNRLTWVTLTIFLLSGIYLSYAPLMNLISSSQRMNTSYNQLHLINSYGAFGTIGKVRNEIIISGTQDKTLNSETKWFEYEFKCKPGNILRRPCLITPYHYRLDWQIWFSAMRPQLSEVWLLRLGIGLLQAKPEVLNLIDYSPFSNQPANFIKMDLYRYEWTDSQEKSWWKRRYLKTYLQPISMQHPLVKKYQF